MFFNFFKRMNPGTRFCVASLANRFGYIATAQAFSDIVCSKFSQDLEIRFSQMTQFLREEADAASQGNKTAREFAARLFADPSRYRGAMNENFKPSIADPQSVLIKLSFLMHRSDDEDFAVKFRCAVVERVQLAQKVLFICINADMAPKSALDAFKNEADRIIEKEFPSLHGELNDAKKVLHHLVEHHPSEYNYLINSDM